MFNKLLIGIIALLIVAALVLKNSGTGFVADIEDISYVVSLKTSFLYLAYLGIMLLIGRLIIKRLQH